MVVRSSVLVVSHEVLGLAQERGKLAGGEDCTAKGQLTSPLPRKKK